MADKEGYPYTPDNYSRVMMLGEKRIQNEAFGIINGEHGKIFTIISEPQDESEAQAYLKLLRSELGIEPSSERHIDVSSFLSSMNSGINLYKLGIDQRSLERQSLAENFFQYVYKGFGREGEGYRIGRQAATDSNLKHNELMKDRQTLRRTPLGEFIEGLEIDLPTEITRKLVVVRYPSLSFEDRIRKPSDLERDNLTLDELKEIDSLVALYRIVGQAAGRIRNDEPHGHVVVNIVDSSYRWFLPRNFGNLLDRDGEISVVETPTAHIKDIQMQNAAVEEVIDHLNK